MIYLRQQNLIFLKTRKTASTSIEVALSANAGEGDILTPLAGQAEVMRLKAPYRSAQNWARSKDTEAAYIKHVRKGRGKGVLKALHGRRMDALMDRDRLFANHMPAARARAALGGSAFDRATKIAAVRHPFEVIVSFAWMNHDPSRPFAESVDKVLALDVPMNHEIYEVGGKPVAQHFVRYEHLKDDLAALEARFDLQLLEHLPLTKHKLRQDKSPARAQLTGAQQRDIQLRYWPEFERFAYDPGGHGYR